MAELTRVGDIDLPQDLRWERAAHRVRQVSGVVFGLLLVAALLGLLGRSGPLSDSTVSSGPLTVEYQRFVRLKTSTDITVQLAAGQGNTNVAISNGLLDELEIQSYSAQPQSTSVLPDRTVFTFDQQPPAQVTFSVEPQRIGHLGGTVYGPRGSEVHVGQWVWP